MEIQESFLPVTAGALVIFSLLLAWLLVFTRSLGIVWFQKFFKNDQDLLRAHIDYLMMALLLVAFFLLVDDPPGWMILGMCGGAVLNPFIFLLLAFEPGLRKRKPIWFSLLTTGGFVLTTLGFGGAAMLVIWAYW